MTINQFRKLALSMPSATEGAHMNHPDFRVNGKIFATIPISQSETLGMLKLRPEQQQQFMASHPMAFIPVKGGWGRQGATLVMLNVVDKNTLASAMFTAWLNVAPQKLIDAQGEPRPTATAPGARTSRARRPPRGKRADTDRNA